MNQSDGKPGQGDSSAPLDGLKVLDLSRVLAAPFCAMALADLGAEVIKVEHPHGGDPTRHWGTAVEGGERTYYLSINRNKQSIAIDFSKPEGAALVRDLARQCDIVVENYLLGALEKHGLDFDTLRKENPRLIYCSVSGYGRTGPSASRPGYDSVIQAESGLMSVTGDPQGEPTKAGIPISDITAGMYAIQGILAALLQRHKTGRGQLIDISLFDCTMANHVSVAANALLLNKAPGRFGNSHADIIPQGLYHAKDGPIMFHVGSDMQFEKFCGAVLGAREVARDSRFGTNDARGRNRIALDALIAEALLTRSRTDWMPIFRQAGVPAGLVQNVLDAVNSPQSVARGLVCELDHPTAGKIRLLNSPLKMSESRLAPPTPPPLLGQHTDQILTDWLSLDKARIAALHAAEIIR